MEATRRLLTQPREAVGKHLQEVSRQACRRALRGLDGRLQRLQASLAATLAADAVRARWAAAPPPGPVQGRPLRLPLQPAPAGLLPAPEGRGQGAQAALGAGMRKLLVLADALLRQERLGSAQAPSRSEPEGEASAPVPPARPPRPASGLDSQHGN